MEEIDKKRFAELITGLAQIFIMDISVTDIENYWVFLRGYPLADVERAIVNYCISPEGHKFMPKPGEIVAALRGKNNEQSLLAWTKVMKAMRTAGAYKTIVFDDAVIHSVIDDMGGWIRLCSLPEKELVFQQREFERLYVCYLHRPMAKYPRELTGIFDRENAAGGYKVRHNPILIGDAQQAALVFKNGEELSTLPCRSLSIQQIMQLSQAVMTQQHPSDFPDNKPMDEKNPSGDDNDH